MLVDEEMGELGWCSERGGGSRGVGQMDRTGLYGNRCAGQIGVNW